MESLTYLYNMYREVMLCALHICQNRNTVRRYLDIRIHGKFCG